MMDKTLEEMSALKCMTTDVSFFGRPQHVMEVGKDSKELKVSLYKT